MSIQKKKTSHSQNGCRQTVLNSGEELAVLSSALLASGLPTFSQAHATGTAGIQPARRIETTFTRPGAR